MNGKKRQVTLPLGLCVLRITGTERMYGQGDFVVKLKEVSYEQDNPVGAEVEIEILARLSPRRRRRADLEIAKALAAKAAKVAAGASK